MPITRITANWSGFRGAPGYSNFFFGGAAGDPDDAEQAADAVRNMFYIMRSQLPLEVNISISGTADILDETNGEMIDQVDFPSPPGVTGEGGGSYSAASGAVINWLTQGYRNGRRIRGRTFIVPLASSAYDDDGDLNSDALGDIRAGVQYLTSGSTILPFVIWARPIGGAGGTTAVVTSASVPDLGAILRSRRD